MLPPLSRDGSFIMQTRKPPPDSGSGLLNSCQMLLVIVFLF